MNFSQKAMSFFWFLFPFWFSKINVKFSQYINGQGMQTRSFNISNQDFNIWSQGKNECTILFVNLPNQ